MKKVLYILLFISIILMCGCSKIDDLPKDPVVFSKGEVTIDEEESYMVIEYQDKKYTFYGSLKANNLTKDYSYAFGNCLGYIEGDTNDRIYELRGYSKDEWLINYYVNGEMMEPMVLKEINYSGEIPKNVIINTYEDE